MSDPNPPEQPSFNQPASGDPTTPMPTGGPASPPPGGTSTPAASTPPPPSPSPASAAAPASGGPSGPSGPSTISDPAKEGIGFFNALFDFSFTHFVTPMLVRFVYLLATAALVASWLVFLFGAFARNVSSGLVVLILGPIFLIIYLAVIRMTLEIYLSIVRMSEDIHKRLPQA